MRLTPFFLGITYSHPTFQYSDGDWRTAQVLASCKHLNPETEYWALLTNSQQPWCNAQSLEPVWHWGALRFMQGSQTPQPLPKSCQLPLNVHTTEFVGKIT